MEWKPLTFICAVALIAVCQGAGVQVTQAPSKLSQEEEHQEEQNQVLDSQQQQVSQDPQEQEQDSFGDDPATQPTVTCNAGEFKCENSNVCVNYTWRCDDIEVSRKCIVKVILRKIIWILSI